MSDVVIDLNIVESLADIFIENRELDKGHIEKSSFEIRSWFINYINVEIKKPENQKDGKIPGLFMKSLTKIKTDADAKILQHKYL